VNRQGAGRGRALLHHLGGFQRKEVEAEGVHTKVKEEVLDPAEVTVPDDALAAIPKLHRLHLLLHHRHFVEQGGPAPPLVEGRGGEGRRGVSVRDNLLEVFCACNLQPTESISYR
jgi:hypothetical protein